MKTPQHYLQHFPQHFAMASFLITSGLLAWVTTMDPFRNLNFPWAIDFISDRNPAYKRFKLLESAPAPTDVIIGSSTSEAFVPMVLKEKYQVNAFAANTGGAGLPLRSIMIKQALAKQPNLKRVIYVADLFEFANFELESTVFYQTEMRALLDPGFAESLRPDWMSRVNDFISFLVIDRSFRTFRDYRKFQSGTFQSAYHPDGSTTQSMLGGKMGSSFLNRVQQSSVALQPLYFGMKQLNLDSKQLFRQMIQDIQHRKSNGKDGVTLHVILAPFHEAFFSHFEKHFVKTGVYREWIEFVKSFESEQVRVHDFTYPSYQDHGITHDDLYWQDGTHFTSALMLKMADSIYRKEDLSATIRSR